MQPSEVAILELLDRLEYLERGMKILLGERERRLERELAKINKEENKDNVNS